MKTFHIQGLWQGKTAGGCFNTPSWRYNPQVFIQVEKPLTVQINLLQDIKTKNAIGFYVAKTNRVGVRQLSMPEEVVAKIGFEVTPKLMMTLPLEVGSYVIIPCTYSPAEEGKFKISIASDSVDDSALSLHEIPPGEEWKYISMRGEWKANSAGGCLHHPSFFKNPQFVLKADEPANATIVLSQTQNSNFTDVIGLYVFETKNVKSKLSNVTHKDIIVQSPFSRSTEATVELKLVPKKIYCVIVSTFEAGSEAQFELTVFSDVEIKLHQLKSGSKHTPLTTTTTNASQEQKEETKSQPVEQPQSTVEQPQPQPE